MGPSARSGLKEQFEVFNYATENGLGEVIE